MVEDKLIGAGALFDVARSIYESCGRDTDKAEALLRQRCQADAKLRDEAVHLGCSSAVRSSVSVSRADSWGRANAWSRKDIEETRDTKGQKGPTKAECIRAGVDHTMESLMSFPLPDTRVPLGQATGTQVRTAMEYYAKFRKTFSIRERWLQMIAEKLEPDQVVGDVLTEDELATLQDKAQAGEKS